MNRDLVSKRTRTGFRELLVGWTIAEIEREFDAEHVHPDRGYNPPESGARRSLVEQIYHSLDFTRPQDVSSLLKTFQSILRKAYRTLDSVDSGRPRQVLEELVAALRTDGFDYVDPHLRPSKPATRELFGGDLSVRTISEVTRRQVLDALRVRRVDWAGRLSEREFLGRVLDVEALPSTDGRYDTMAQDIRKHRELNEDWPSDWVYSDPRIDLVNCSDGLFLAFLCELVHPVIRPDSGEVTSLVECINGHLEADGWKLVEQGKASGKNSYRACLTSPTAIGLPQAGEAAVVLSTDYVRELSDKCDARLESGDYAGAITVGVTLLDEVLAELEEHFSGERSDPKGDFPRRFKMVAKRLGLDDGRSDLDERLKDVVRGFFSIIHGLAPVRNRMSDAHPAQRRPAPHHARLVVNAVKTVCWFLVESYLFQRSKRKPLD